MGKLIEFPRKLEWTNVPSMFGEVKELRMCARVDYIEQKKEFVWVAWHKHPASSSLYPTGAVIIARGRTDSMEDAMEEVKEALEKVPIIRPVDRR